jgi:hypothetical protein
MSLLPPIYGQSPLTLWLLQTGSMRTEASSSSSNPVQVDDHLKWARAIARNVRLAFHFVAGSQEEQDLEQTAYLTILELIQRFDIAKVPPGGDLNGAFRGWAAIEVQCRCRREARRLRNGGTYHTRRETAGKALVIERLRNGPDLIDPRSLIEENESEDELDQ